MLLQRNGGAYKTRLTVLVWDVYEQYHEEANQHSASGCDIALALAMLDDPRYDGEHSFSFGPIRAFSEEEVSGK